MDEKKGVPGYQVMLLCPACAEKMDRIRILEETGEEAGQCALCWRERRCGRFKVWPQPKTRYKSYTGGGERARAGRR